MLSHAKLPVDRPGYGKKPSRRDLKLKQMKEITDREKEGDGEVCGGDRRSGERTWQRRDSQQHWRRSQGLWPPCYLHQDRSSSPLLNTSNKDQI